MRIIIVGLGVQGKKRLAIAKSDTVSTVDPFKESDYDNLYDVPLKSFDSAILCIQDDLKIEYIKYLLSNKKNVMVEKPIFSSTSKQIKMLKNLAEENNVCCYTAYNHRFEPNFIKMKKLLDEKKLGKVYTIRMFYGNGTARLVRDSEWRDKGAGVLPDLGSHLLDTLEFWFSEQFTDFKIISATKNENQSYDNVVFGKLSSPTIIAETSLLSWRNHFYADIYGEYGSAHITSLCKWGPSKFIFRKRIIPSGRPIEESSEIISSDPTWELEYNFFKEMISKKHNNLGSDIWINDVLNKVIN
tara:strand:- start:428 stop:1327 length:900 start_codon:yes stop_codon:yes gene_type:complete